MSLSVEDKALLLRTISRNPYIPYNPSPLQAKMLVSNAKELLFGGSGGGGKSFGMLMCGLMYIEEPNYNALILRSTLKQLKKPDALIPLAKKWLLNPAIAKDKNLSVHWSAEDYIFTFPNGSTLSFGYLEHYDDLDNYQGPAYQFIGFDELTQFKFQSHYEYLFTRLRRAKKSNIPGRIRATSNPGGRGHEWVKERFITNPDALFIKSTYLDNPYLDHKDYEDSFSHIKDPVVLNQLKYGDWDITPDGNTFRRNWFNFVNFAAFQNTQARIVKAIRFWDLAKTKPNKKNPDPDWTVGVLLWLDNFGKLWIKDVVYLRDTPEVCGELIYRTALKDGSATSIGFETEPGGMSGYGLNYLTQRLNGFNTTVRETTNKSKANRITNASSFTEKHGVNIIGLSDTGKMLPWVEFFLGQLLPYPSAGYHDDCVDAYGGAFYSMGLNIENPRQLIYDNYGRRRSKGLRAF